MIANLLSVGLGALAAKAVSTAMGNNSPQALQDMFASASVSSSLVRPTNNLVHRIFNSNLKDLQDLAFPDDYIVPHHIKITFLNKIYKNNSGIWRTSFRCASRNC